MKFESRKFLSIIASLSVLAVGASVYLRAGLRANENARSAFYGDSLLPAIKRQKSSYEKEDEALQREAAAHPGWIAKLPLIDLSEVRPLEEQYNAFSQRRYELEQARTIVDAIARALIIVVVYCLLNLGQKDQSNQSPHPTPESGRG